MLTGYWVINGRTRALQALCDLGDPKHSGSECQKFNVDNLEVIQLSTVLLLSQCQVIMMQWAAGLIRMGFMNAQFIRSGIPT